MKAAILLLMHLFRAVSLGVPSSRSPGVNARMGRYAPNRSKTPLLPVSGSETQSDSGPCVGFKVIEIVRMASLGPDHFEAVPSAAIPVRRGHAADEKKLVGPNPLLLHIEQFLAQVNAFDQADHDAIASNL